MLLHLFPFGHGLGSHGKLITEGNRLGSLLLEIEDGDAGTGIDPVGIVFRIGFRNRNVLDVQQVAVVQPLGIAVPDVGVGQHGLHRSIEVGYAVIAPSFAPIDCGLKDHGLAIGTEGDRIELKVLAFVFIGEVWFIIDLVVETTLSLGGHVIKQQVFAVTVADVAVWICAAEIEILFITGHSDLV